MPTGSPSRRFRVGMLGLALAAGLAGAASLRAAEGVQVSGPVTGLPLPRYVSIRADSANARRGPGLDHRVDWEFVRRNLPVEVTAEYGNWRRVRDMDGMGGWIHHTLLSGVRTGLIIGSAPAPLRTDPDAEAPLRAIAEPGVVLRLEECRGAWCEVSSGGFKGWIDRAKIWGVTPSEEFD